MPTDSLTTEQLRKQFKNNFDLCSFSINIARNLIQAGVQISLGEILEKVAQRADESQSG